jgi:hypothetical protein
MLGWHCEREDRYKRAQFVAHLQLGTGAAREYWILAALQEEQVK